MIERLAYSPRDLAARWQCSERHIRNLINRGELPYFQLGGKLVRITPDAVREFEQCRQSSRVVPYRGKFAVEWYEGGIRRRSSLRTADRGDVQPALRRFIADFEADRRPSSITVEYAWSGYRDWLGDKPAAVTMGHEWKALGPHFGAMAADGLTNPIACPTPARGAPRADLTERSGPSLVICDRR